MTRRSKNAIISDILEICKYGACKTKIVYQANLNFGTANPYIDMLVKNNLLEVKQEENVVYKTTDKGIHLLDDLKRINSKLSELWVMPSVLVGVLAEEFLIRIMMRLSL